MGEHSLAHENECGIHTPNLKDSRTTEYTLDSTDVGTDSHKTEGCTKMVSHAVIAVRIHCKVTDDHSELFEKHEVNTLRHPE